MATMPWCPAGCQKEIGEYKFFWRLAEKAPIQEEGDHRVDCPVCGRPILIETEDQPDYQCRKGDGWKT